MRWVGHIALMAEIGNVYKILVEKPEQKRPLERPRCSWEDNIKIYLREIEFGDVYWIHLAPDTDWQRLLSTQ
jgi:hypothetical protein